MIRADSVSTRASGLRKSRATLIAVVLGFATCMVLADACFALAPKSDAASRNAARPNIVFILADDLGYGELGCYGQQILKTPNIDRLAREGIRFTDCYAGSTVCAPSRCVLMTGLHTGHCHVRGNALVPLRPQDVTVAELLAKAGYHNGLFGKWGLGEPGTTGIPQKKGFHEFFGYLNQAHAHDYYTEFLWRGEEKFSLPGNKSTGGVASVRQTYSHDVIVERALDFLDRNQQRPFFLYLPVTLPHVNNERMRANGDGMEVPDYGEFESTDWPKPEKGRARMIQMLDRDVGRVLERLAKLGLAERTIVFFSSDNGAQKEGGSSPQFFASSGPLRGTKRDLYEGGVRVPMIVRWPGKIPVGKTSDFRWGFWDLLPTACALASAESPMGLDGISVLPALLGENQSRDDIFYWEFHEGGFSQAARMNHWKAVRRGRMAAPLELYDLLRDVGERANVAADHPDVVARFEAYLAKARTDSAEFPITAPRRRSAAAKSGG